MTDSTAGITEALQATSIEDQGHKVFVGNLSFATKEDELKEVFSKHGTLSEVQIILRGTRSLGYGFVTFASQDDATKAVSALDKSEIGGRTVNVEIAKPPPGTPGGAIPRAAAKAAKKAAAQANGTGETAAPAAEGEGQAKKSRNSRRKKRTGATAAEGDATAEPVVAPQVLAADGTAAPVVPVEGAAKKSRKSKKGKKEGAAAATNGEEGAAPARKARVGPPQGEPSKTLLFVANLPFSLTDEGLKAAFADYKTVSAHVVKRRFGPAEGRSKGFGFVELESHEEQQKALEGVQGKEIEGRGLQVKVAVNEAKEKVEADQEKPAAEAVAA